MITFQPSDTRGPFAGARPGRARMERADSLGLRRPNLFVIGAMKSGTTYLSKLLGAHPAIFMCAPEEPSYFVDPRQLRTLWPEAWDLGIWRAEENYLRLFGPAGDAVWLAEASTNYSKRPLVSGVAERLHRFNPDARLIYLLRDPVQRSISHYWHMVRYHAERRPMLEALRDEPHYLDVSNYAMQLAPYLERFGAHRILILTFEELTRAPAAAMRRICAWLGLRDVPAMLPGAYAAENVTPDELCMARWGWILRQVRQSRSGRLLRSCLPGALRARAMGLVTRPVDRRTVDATAATAFLRAMQAGQAEALAQMAGRAFPEWTTLHGTVPPDMGTT